MKEICPISFSQVNEKVVRINATLSILSIILLFFTSFKVVILILGIDFFIRGFLNPKYSPYSAISKTILYMFKAEPLMVNAGPKIFAARVGFIFCCLIALSCFLNFDRLSLIIGSIFIFFAALETIFKFCLACKIYPLIHRA